MSWNSPIINREPLSVCLCLCVCVCVFTSPVPSLQRCLRPQRKQSQDEKNQSSPHLPHAASFSPKYNERFDEFLDH